MATQEQRQRSKIVAAGSGKYNTTNTSYYLYRPGYWYWSLSPYYYGKALVFRMYRNGNLNNGYVTGGGAIAPVINLSDDYVGSMKGTGTMGDPYQA